MFSSKLLAFICGTFFCCLVLAKEVPSLKYPVTDQVNLLTSTQKAELNKRLLALYKNGGPQIAILIVDSLDGEYIEGYSIKVVDKWKLGSEKKDNGLLFLMALKERKMRIEVGQGLEGDITDAYSSRIIRKLGDFFKQRQFADGLHFMLSAMTSKLGIKEKSQYVRKRSESLSSSEDGLRLIFYILLFIAFIIMRVFSSAFGIGSGRGYYSGGHSGGSYYGGGSSGGGFSGGGGGFSGGGASGGW